MNNVRGIDLDEVLFETVNQWLIFHGNKINNIFATREDISDYHFYKIEKFNLSKDTSVDRFRSFLGSESTNDILPVVWAKEWLERIKAQWNTLIGITWRLAEYESWTDKALKNYYDGLLSKVIYLGAYSDMSSPKVTQRTKSEVCKELGITTMVEDDMYFAQELADNGVKVYLLAKPWNVTQKNGMHPNIIKVSWWDEILV